MAGTPARKRRRIKESRSTSVEGEESAPTTSRDKGKQRAVDQDDDYGREGSSGHAQREGTDLTGAGDTEERNGKAAHGSRAGPSIAYGGNGEGDEVEDPELEEKWRIWDLFTEDYHDITEQLPLEIQRNFQLMLEHDEQVKKAEKDLRQALVEYRSIARTSGYKDAIARDLAAGPDLPHASRNAAMGETSGTNGCESGPSVRSLRDPSITSEEDVRSALLPQQAGQLANRQQEPNGQSRGERASTTREAAEHLKGLLRSMASHSHLAIKAGEDKVALAVTAYNWTDRHIQRLDSDILKCEESLSLGLRAGTLPSTDALGAQVHAKENMRFSALLDGAAVPGGGKADTLGGNSVDGGSVATNTEGQAGADAAKLKKPQKKQNRKGPRASVVVVDPENYIKIPREAVGPNEPTYCYCNQVSMGEMIACENQDCPKEWFHLQCIGLFTAPKGQWWCRSCAAEFGKTKWM